MLVREVGLIQVCAFFKDGESKVWKHWPNHSSSPIVSPFDLVVWTLSLIYFFKDLLFLEAGGRKKRGRETQMCSCLSCAPYWGPGPQSRHVPCLIIELATLWFAGRHSIHWAAGGRAELFLEQQACKPEPFLCPHLLLHEKKSQLMRKILFN